MSRGLGTFVLITFVCGMAIIPAAIFAQEGASFTQGVRQFEDGDYQSAIQTLEQVTQANPEMESAWYYLGLAAMKTGDYRKSLEAFQRAVEISPSRPGTRLFVGEIYESQGAFTEAIHVYQEEVRLRRGKDVWPVLSALGRAYYYNNDPVSAVATLSRVLRNDNKQVEALYYTGLAQMQLGDINLAVRHFRLGLEVLDEWRTLNRRLSRLRDEKARGHLPPEEQRKIGEFEETLAQEYSTAHEFASVKQLWPTLNKTLGDALLARQEWSAARNAYRRALRLDELGDPSDADAYSRIGLGFLKDARDVFENRGLLFQCIGILKDAIESIEKAQQLNSTYAPAYNALGLVYLFQAQTYTTNPALGIFSHTPEDAIGQFEQALQHDPNYVEAMSNIAEALLMVGRDEEARQHLTKALTLQPGNAQLHAEMAAVLFALEDPDGSLREAQTARSIDRNNVKALNVAGLVYMYYRGNLGEAIELFTRAVRLEPRRAEGFINLGLAYYQMESWYRARLEFRRALELVPTATVANTAIQQAYLFYLIGLTHHQTGAHDREIEALNEALGRHPSHLDTLRQLALAYEAQQQYRAAEQVLREALDRSPSAEMDGEIHVQRGAMLEKQGRSHDAIAAYAAALDADPNNPMAQQGMERLQQAR